MRFIYGLLLLSAVSMAHGQAVSLKLKFVKGKKTRMVSTTKMNMSVGGATTMKMTSASTMALRTQVLNTSSFGSKLRMTYEGVKSSSTVNGKTMPSQSEQPNLAGKAVTVTFDSLGKMKRVEGVKGLVPAGPAGDMFGSMFSDEGMKQMMDSTFGAFPHHPVQPGDSWTASMKFGGGPFSVQIDMTLQLQKIEMRNGHHLAVIGISGTGKLDMSQLPNGASMTGNAFPLSGSYVFDVERGWTVESQAKMSAHMTFNSGQANTPATDMDITMVQKAVFTTLN